MRDITKKDMQIMERLDLTRREYLIARATLDRAKEVMLSLSPCMGCALSDTCKRLGKPEACLHSGFADEARKLADRLNVVNPYLDD